ncbi:ABC transporter ATP-binding protein [Hymenobacter sediminis]|uniref:ABC-F family ATP-binding cassette domain-containing protein n=1 Tax=Hymenobacter sediminis TaxID=2218621 RepID=UPI000DA66A27|nr:ATP-binding cassette domain-containing protein [Hymenobacter sediminis]RPD45200.1 ABC transporter ATP-binding protein [Hymenobacter sediminis]
MSIVVNALAYHHPNRELLFQDISLAVGRGEKAALVGNNGVGKSTLLQLVARQLAPTAGEISISEAPYYVPQHLGQYDDFSVAQALGVADKLQALGAILEGDTSPEYFALLNDDWEIEERVLTALTAWKLQHLPLTQPLKSLSGGEKTKVFLAGILIHTPGIILLDEPSNHLDAESRTLLYGFIQRSRATVLLVSHDRALLNLLDVTLELSSSSVEVYGGNYDFYRAQKEGKLTALQARLEEQEKTLKQTQQKARGLAEQRQKLEARGKAQQHKKALPRIVAGSLKSKAEQSSAQQKEVQNDKIQDLTDNLRQTRTQIQEQQVLRIDLKKPDLHRGKILVEAKAINFAYGAAPLWKTRLTFQLRSGDRIRIAGRNGSGKTTLLRLLMGKLLPSTGQLTLAEFRYLYLDQEYSVLDNQLSVVEQAEQFNTRHLPEHDLKMLLHYHQFRQESWDRKCGSLSGGEKMKLILCCLAISDNTPDLLILDEPTNNLDLYSQEIVTEAVRSFAGSIMVISHDEFFIREVGIDSTIELG